MNNKIDNVISTLNKGLRKSLNGFEGLYVFGSQIKNAACENSDIDVVVILKTVNRKQRGIIWRLASQIEYDCDVLLDIHPLTAQELKRNSIFYDEVVNKGKFYANS
jgi:predicted nucleotidyltransferase